MELSTIIVAHKEVEIKFDGPRREPRRPGGSMLGRVPGRRGSEKILLYFLDNIGIMVLVRHSIVLKSFIS